MRELESYKTESLPVSETTPLVAFAGQTKKGKKWEFGGDRSHNRLVKHGRNATGRRKKLKGTGVTAGLSQEQLHNLIDAFAREDKDEEKTWARRVVEKFLQKVYRREAGSVCLRAVWSNQKSIRLIVRLTLVSLSRSS
jgi:hypothetical protein